MKANKLITKLLSKFILIIQILLFSSIGIVTEPFFSNMTKDKILPADEAFLFEAYLQNEESIILTWAMKENCFLYKDKFKIYTDNTNIIIRETNGEAKRINDLYFGVYLTELVPRLVCRRQMVLGSRVARKRERRSTSLKSSITNPVSRDSITKPLRMQRCFRFLQDLQREV